MIQPIFKVEFLTHVTNRTQSLGKQDIGRAALQPPVGTRKEEANAADSAANKKISRSMHSEPFGAHVHAKTGPLCRKKKNYTSKCTWIVIVDVYQCVVKIHLPALAGQITFSNLGRAKCDQCRRHRPPPTLAQRVRFRCTSNEQAHSHLNITKWSPPCNRH